MSISLLIYTLIGFIVTLGWWANIHPIVSVIRQVLILTYTLVHEFAHAAVSSFTKGRVFEMKLNYDASGHVVSANEEDNSLLVTFAGYTLPCFISLIMYILLEAERSAFVLVLFISIAGFSFIFIRNWYGAFWLIGFIALNVVVYIYASPAVMEHVAMFFSAVLFAGSVYGGWRIFIMSIRNPEEAGDAASLGEKTWIPTQVWGFVFFAISLATLIVVPAYFYAAELWDVPYLQQFQQLIRPN